ncbi:early endosome antigen 1-like isoform X1 [Oncorhynchus masou masou]|uniref:early endosome antigen 1-like isoform X1 n=2 Tax=Oncorhynchus masou masou TaxID=90313 RepID=UPI00318318B3
MLRRILQMTPGKGGSQNSESDQPSADLNNDQTSEGFICPQCMKSHNSAEELFKHYELYHDSGDQPPSMGPGREDFILLRQELQEMQTSLKEERWFSGELKKELDKVQGHLKQGQHNDSQAGSEDSALAVKLNQAETEKFNIKQMKDLFEQKAAQLATEIVDIKSRYDEEKSLREAADQRLANLIQELQRERQDKDRLHTELLQRPGVEDMEVLQKELIQVQTLMDNMTREREEESARLKSQYEQLQADHTTSEMTISQLKAELEKGPQEAAVYTQQIHQLQSSLNNLQQQSQMLSETLGRREKEFQELEDCLGAEQASKKTAQDSLHQTEMEVQELQARVAGAEASLQRAQSELGEEAGRLRREVAELEAKHGEVKAERKQLQLQREERESQGLMQQSEINQLHAKLLEAERQLGEVQGRLKEQRQLSGEKLKDREQQTADLQIKLSRSEEQLKENSSKMLDVQHQLEKAKQQHQELQGLQQNTNTKLREAQNDLEQVLRQIGDKDQKIQNLEALLQKTKDSVSQLEAEREDLVAKIQAGEGETAVLNQLQEKNHTLQTQVTHLTDKLKNQSESHKQAQDNLHKQVQEQKSLLRAAQDRAQTVETSLGELNAQLTESREKVAQLDTQLKSKTEMLLSAEAAKAAQRVDLENHLETAQHALQDKQQELNKSQACVEEQGRRLQERHEQCGQLEASLKEVKDKLLTSEQCIEQLGGRAKKAEAEGVELRAAREQTQQEVQKLQKQGSEVKGKLKELGRLLETEKAGAAVLQEELKRKTDSLSDTRQQLERCEQEKTSLQASLDKRAQEGQVRQAELDRKAQGLAGDLQKAMQEKEAQWKELAAANDGLAKASKALKESQSQLDKERKSSKIVLEEKEKSHEMARQELLKATKATTKEIAEVKGQLENIREAEKGLKMQLTVLTEQHNETQEALKEKEKGVQQLQTQLKTAQGSFNQENKKLESQVSELQGAHARKAEEEGRLKEQVSGLGQELSSERIRTTELQKALEQSQEGLAKMQSDYYGKESEVSSLRQDLAASEERLTLSQEELAANRTQLTGLEGHVQEVEAARTSLKQELAKRDQRLGQQETALKELQKNQGVTQEELQKERRRVKELNQTKAALEKDTTRLGSELKALGERSAKELKELGEAKQLLIQQKLEVQGHVEEVQAALEQEKTLHQVTRDSVTQREEKSRVGVQEIQAQLASERKVREEQAKRGEEAEARLGLQVTALNENVATLKREWQGSQRRCGELEKQTDELRGEIAVLEATVQNNQDERRALLERCVKGEGEMEKLQSKVVEMRRKLDDTTAAMQELGRENQSLQIKQSQSLTRKWAEDHEVQNCMACGKGFSLAIRKHHCRHCGNIFCAECSAKNALTPSSKKPVRVCETCFEDLQG